MSARRARGAGFTIVELMVALLLMGVIATGLLFLTRAVLGFTGLATSVATSVQAVSQAEAYLADKFRLAKRVDGSEVLVDAGGATVLNCDVNATPQGRCLTVLTPVLGSEADQPIVDFDLSAFSVQPMDSLYEDVGVPRGYDGSDTLALVEYRVEGICDIAGTNPCSNPPNSLSQAQRTVEGDPGLLITGISPIDGNGDTVATFDVGTGSTGGTTLVMRIVARTDSSRGQPFIVRETPVELGVSVRGIIEPE